MCDPWFEPAFFGSWFPFPRNDQLGAELLNNLEHPSFLYISHQHGDHLDETWLAFHLDKSTPVLLPDFPTRELERQLSRLGFAHSIRTRDLAALRSHGSVDMHWLQFSGAIWYPMVYEDSPEHLLDLARAKVENQFSRAMHIGCLLQG